MIIPEISLGTPCGMTSGFRPDSYRDFSRDACGDFRAPPGFLQVLVSLLEPSNFFRVFLGIHPRISPGIPSLIAIEFP